MASDCKIKYKRLEELEYITPYYQPKRQTMIHRVAPREIIDFLSEDFGPDLFQYNSQKPLKRTIYGCTNNSGESVFNISVVAEYYIEELVYPGSSADIIGIEDKWIYVLRGNKFIREIYVENPDSWFQCAQIKNVEKTKKDFRIPINAHIKLPRGNPKKPIHYDFFLSSIRLNEKAKKYLQDNYFQSDHAISSCSSQMRRKVFLIDHIEWALRIHKNYYLPLAQSMIKLLISSERGAQIYLSSVLKSLKNNEDPLNLDEFLQKGEPQSFFNFHKNELKEKKVLMEEAGSYLAHFIESHEFLAMEIAAEDNDEELLKILKTWASITPLMTLSDAGKILIKRTVKDVRRFPSRYIFNESPPKSSVIFSDCRWRANAMISIANEFIPEVMEFVSAENKIKRYLKNIKNLTSLEETQLNEIIKGHGIKGQKKKIRLKKGRARKRGLAKVNLDFDQSFLGKASNTASSSFVGKSYLKYQDVLEFSGLTIGTVFEVINLYKEVGALYQAGKEKDAKHWVNGVGSVADAAEHSIDVFEAFLSGTSKSMKVVGNSFGILAGVCDLFDFGTDSVGEFGELDYGAGIGKGMQAFGAASSITGSVIGICALKGYIAGSWSGVGGIITAIGGVLIGVGSVLYISWKKTPYEFFASRCFLGKHNLALGIRKYWHTENLPSGSMANQVSEGPLSVIDIDHEIEVLQQLLGHFKVSIRGGSPSQFLQIRPGQYSENSCFILHLSYRWKSGEERKHNNIIIPLNELEREGTVRIKGIDNSFHLKNNQIQVKLSPINDINLNNHGVNQEKRIQEVSIDLNVDEGKSNIGNRQWPDVTALLLFNLNGEIVSKDSILIPARKDRKTNTSLLHLKIISTSHSGCDEISSFDEFRYEDDIK
jgi:hypothetical protein